VESAHALTSLRELATRLPRHAFSARDAARAGDVWRCLQEAAVEASTLAGWPPQRYRAEQTAFIVRSMSVVHHREAEYGERIDVRTWVSRWRREMFTTREIRLVGESGPIASATQEWVHVSASTGLEPARGSRALLDSFPVHDGGPPVELPAFAPSRGSARGEAPRTETRGTTARFELDCWWTWMDPLDHVNHPAYVDFCDEAISRRLAAAGIRPVELAPVAEKLTFRSGISAGERLVVELSPIGTTDAGALVLGQRVLAAPDRLCADGIAIRRLAGGDSAPLVAAFEA
jgi:acyl-CoA thioesterase FadM